MGDNSHNERLPPQKEITAIMGNSILEGKQANENRSSCIGKFDSYSKNSKRFGGFGTFGYAVLVTRP